MSSPKPRLGRKLLVASVGVAAISYVACSSDGNDVGSGNLAPPPDTGMVEDTAVPPMEIGSGNLAPPPDSATADTTATDSSSDGTTDGSSD